MKNHTCRVEAPIPDHLRDFVLNLAKLAQRHYQCLESVISARFEITSSTLALKIGDMCHGIIDSMMIS